MVKLSCSCLLYKLVVSMVTVVTQHQGPASAFADTYDRSEICFEKKMVKMEKDSVPNLLNHLRHLIVAKSKPQSTKRHSFQRCFIYLGIDQVILKC